jgi:hypothetical protein
MYQIEASETSPALPSAWIEKLFTRLATMYGNKFLDMWKGLDLESIKTAWGEDLAGYSGDELKRGLEWCKTQPWPPTLPEFMTACRPVLDAKTEWAEACEQMRIRIGGGVDCWSRPQVYWAAVAVSWHDLNSMSWDQIKTRWTHALTHARNTPVPEYLVALPAPGQQTVPREEAADRMRELSNMVKGVTLPGTTKAGTRWAYLLMEREANGEQLPYISTSAWREVLGYGKDEDAKKVLAEVRKAESQQEAA